MSEQRIRTKEKDAIIQSLKSGVTPKIGIQHIQVGRSNELQALYQDIERICDGGSAFRLIIGDYGSGKTFFLSVVRSMALEKKLVTVNADLSPNRRIHASAGQARNLYSELMRNISTRTKPDGNALTSIVEKFITLARQEADQKGIDVTEAIQSRLHKLAELVGGGMILQKSLRPTGKAMKAMMSILSLMPLGGCVLNIQRRQMQEII